MKMGQRLLTATEKVWKVGPGQNILSFVEATMHLLFPLLLIIGSPMATDMNKQYKKKSTDSIQPQTENTPSQK